MTEKNNLAAADLESITLRELGEACRKTENCLKCELIEFCSSYARFMNAIRPRWWLSVEEQTDYEMPDLTLTKESYKLRRRES